MKDYIDSRAKEIAVYIIENNSTVREAGKVFSISKSTVHKDVAERLQYIDARLYKMVREVLDVNFRERHIRGGEATKKRFKKN